MITWSEKVAFVGLKVKPMSPGVTGVDSCYRYKIKLCYDPGVCSIGHGDTVDDAIKDAAFGMQISWDSVENKITEQEWERIAHT